MTDSPIEDGNEWLAAFGYTSWENLWHVHSVQVAEGKHPATLQPIVVIRLRFDADEDQIGFEIHPDLADDFADELHRWAQRAREKHYE